MGGTFLLSIGTNGEALRSVKILRSHGVEVQESPDFSQWIAKEQPQWPSILLVDLETLSHPDFQSFLQSFQGHLPKLLVQMPALSEPQEEACERLHADAFLIPPVQPSVLVGTVRSLMQSWELEQVRDALALKLRSTEEDLHRSLARIAHDFSEPVRVTETLLDLLGAGGLNRFTDRERICIDLARQSLQRSRNFLRDLSLYAQVARDSADTHQNIGLKGAVAAALAQMRSEMGPQDAQVQVGPLPVVRGNPARLQQLMGILASNALKFRKPGVRPEITIEASPEPADRWLIRVTDNGVGIGKDHVRTIFEPFVRLHGRDIPGTGLGLAVARRIVEAHGGTIRAESEPGAGSTFLFTLPAAPNAG